MLRALAALIALVPLLWAMPARAQAGETYCVGGYEGTPPDVLAACAMPSVREMHEDWHYHNWVTNGQECFICYDEEDSTCETKFLRRNRGTWRRADPYECARLYGEKHGAGNVVEHVINGEPVTPGAPPPPMQLEARVERISPGPYTAGDKVTVVGAVRDESGAARPLTGGTFRVTDASGKSSEHAGTVQPDGTVSAGFSLPASDSVRIEFIPKLPSLGRNEKLRAEASEAQGLKVEVCGFRARVVQPAEHEALVSGQAIALSARLFDAAGQVPVASPPAGLSLEFTVQVDGEQPRVLRADGALSATWTPPASPKPREVRFSAGGRTGERVVCPAGEVSATVSDLGLGFDTSELPRTCYVGLPCQGTVRLLRPEPGTGRQQVDALLADPKVEARVVDTGEERYRGPPRADDRYEFSATYGEPGAASWSIVFQTPKGPVSMPTHEVRVRPQLKLELPAELDFGTVTAGASVSAACQKLDFSGSQGAEEHRWELRAEGLGGCQSRLVLRFLNTLGQEDARGLAPSLGIEALDPKDRRLDICLEVPRCAGEVSPDSAVLRVVPLTPEFKAQEKTVRLRWKVEGRGFLGCHGAWVWPTLALLGFGLVIAGFTQPARFPPGASIRVAGSERGMRQSAAILLQACPGSSPGFYRDARLGLHGDGEVNGRTRNAAIVLRATRGAGVVLTGLGPLEQQDRRSLQWEPVTDLAQGHVPSPSVLYRAGGTYFKVEL
ncbi:hypothetical protein ATI61_110346 [Archangium gephyra]|uniref:Carboxypeptidase regulatory-like domain-containing protein n=1 Tax=Archangium gephyra TaxID=48 RepID=A0AAC8QE87_9BACT|nr:hypothetical protein [Archangium gephyra]AKJ05906.1 Hypothetical protein AA314_07532 [Archangium gephyra]REG27339.1 hypothetical protein ATI61_110346 [Archangium gephyra]